VSPWLAALLGLFVGVNAGVVLMALLNASRSEGR
jgi:uncharacterized membrane-anchored protein YhcB (DUF1043 family)